MDKTLISVLAGLGGMVGWGTSDFFANLASDKVGHSKAVFWSQIFGMILLGILLLAMSPVFSFSASIVLFTILSALFYIVGYIYFYKAFEVGNVSVVSGAINLNVVLAMIFAYIFLGERLIGFQPIGVLLVIVGVVLVSVNFKNLINSKISLLAGVKETLIASVAFAIYWNLDKVVVGDLGWLPAAFFIKVCALLILLFWSVFSKNNIKYDKSKLSFLPTIALVGILEAGAVAMVNWGLSVGDIVIVSPISSALTIVTIVLAVIFLKEKITKVQIFGILTSIVGIVLTAI